MQEKLKVGVLTVSDRAFAGEYEDRSGPAIVQYLKETVSSPLDFVTVLINDEQELIETNLIDLVDRQRCHWVLTTGGTGPAPRDVTPEATVKICSRIMPGFGEQMRRVSVAKVPTAILSRQTAGIRGTCFVLNLPGSPKAIAECLDAVMPAIPDCLDHIGAPRIEIYADRFQVYRPHE